MKLGNYLIPGSWLEDGAGLNYEGLVSQGVLEDPRVLDIRVGVEELAGFQHFVLDTDALVIDPNDVDLALGGILETDERQSAARVRAQVGTRHVTDFGRHRVE